MMDIRNFSLRAAVLATSVLAPAAAASADTIYGLTASNRIVAFNAATPGTVTSNYAITGIAPGDTLIGIDRRPVDRQLYTLGRSGSLYRLTATATGYAATNLGTLPTSLSGNSFGFDFNPTVDRLRVVSDANQNLRINPNAMPPGAIIDGALTLNGSSQFDLLASAYTNNFAGATTTRLFGIDARTGGLVRSTNANAGTYVNTSPFGVAYQTLGLAIDNSDQLGFDISGNTGRGYFNFRNGLYGINLGTGTPTFLGTIGTGSLIGLAAGTVPEPQSWALLIAGFGLVGAAQRRRHRIVRAAA